MTNTTRFHVSVEASSYAVTFPLKGAIWFVYKACVFAAAWLQLHLQDCAEVSGPAEAASLGTGAECCMMLLELRLLPLLVLLLSKASTQQYVSVRPDLKSNAIMVAATQN